MDIIEIAKAHWQERRFGNYQRAQFHRARKRKAVTPNELNEILNAWRRDRLLTPEEQEANRRKSPVPAPEPEKTGDDASVDLADFITLDQLNKELDVDYKLRSRTERLYKRYFQKKAMKAIINQQHSPPPPPLIEASPTLAVTATTPEE